MSGQSLMLLNARWSWVMISAGTDGMVSWTWHYIKVWLHLLQPPTISSLSIRQSRHQSVMFDLTGVSWGRLGERRREGAPWWLCGRASLYLLIVYAGPSRKVICLNLFEICLEESKKWMSVWLLFGASLGMGSNSSDEDEAIICHKIIKPESCVKSCINNQLTVPNFCRHSFYHSGVLFALWCWVKMFSWWV